MRNDFAFAVQSRSLSRFDYIGTAEYAGALRSLSAGIIPSAAKATGADAKRASRDAACPGEINPGMASEIISERRASSNRNGGRHHLGFACDFPGIRMRGVSAKFLQRELGVAHQTAWTMAYKQRHGLSEDPSRPPISIWMRPPAYSASVLSFIRFDIHADYLRSIRGERG